MGENMDLTLLAEQKKPSPAQQAQLAAASSSAEKNEAAEELNRPLPLNNLLPNLKTVYAYENKLLGVGPLGERVEHLYLQSDRLEEMVSWSRQFPKLKALKLDRNRIRCLEGLDRSSQLEELSIARQQ